MAKSGDMREIISASDEQEQGLFQRIDFWRNQNPGKLLYSYLDVSGNQVESHTYNSFYHRLHSIAAFLSSVPGLVRGDRIVIMFPPGLEMICTIFACVRAGLIPVPTSAPSGYNSESSLRRVCSIAANCEPSCLISNAKGLEVLSDLIHRNQADEVGDLSRLKALRTLNTDEIQNIDPKSHKSILQSVESSDIFLIQYTSGSTSEPKGVMLSVANILANADIVVDHESPICVSWLPQHHDMGLLGYYIYVVLHGGTTYGFSPSSFIQRPLLWLDTISKYRATATSVPNFALEMCLNAARVSDLAVSKLNLSSLRFLMVAAEPIDSELFMSFGNRFTKASLNLEALFVAYGLAEFTLAVTNYGRNVARIDSLSMSTGKISTLHSSAPNGILLMSCGKPLPGNEVQIVNPETRNPCADGIIGEVWIHGPSKALGYWSSSAEQADVFRAQIAGSTSEKLYLRSGDMGFVYDQELFICGRYKEMIVLRGENYFPQDIERAVLKYCPDLEPRTVVAFEYKEQSRTNIAVVIETKRSLDYGHRRQVVSLVRSKIGVEIDSVIFVPAKTLPKTTSGKLMRLEARKRWLNGDYGDQTPLSRPHSGDLVSLTLSAAKDIKDYFQILSLLHGIKGDEAFPITDLAVDSIELVTLIGLIKDELEAQGRTYLADQVDIRLLQAVSIAELSKLYLSFAANAPGDLTIDSELTQIIHSIRCQRLSSELQQMKIDAKYPYAAFSKSSSLGDDILLTGGTGFLGPFLLKSLLEQSLACRRIKVLVRGSNPQEALIRLRKSLLALSSVTPDIIDQFEKRVDVVCGNLALERFGIPEEQWNYLTKSVSTIYHNGAIVNYLMSYAAMRDVNVLGTQQVLRLASEAGVSDFNHISTTFIFGWSAKPILLESDNNNEMKSLNFGYSQSKWVSEQLVLAASREGLPVRIFRPSLVTPSLHGEGMGLDISMRLLLFMIKYGLTVSSQNQISFTPVDIVAQNIVAISCNQEALGGTYHVVQDVYNDMRAITDQIGLLTGLRFTPLSLAQFAAEAKRLCTNQDPLYPLLNFLVNSTEYLEAMEFKRYSSSEYQHIRNNSPNTVADPSLADTVKAILAYLPQNILQCSKAPAGIFSL